MAKKPQRQPTPQQIDAAQRILAHDHKRVYGQGAKGTTIRALQIALAAQGYEPGGFDGSWGDKTQTAFDKYMRDRGQVFGSATPKGLAFISKEIGQPLPRQRPAHAADDPLAGLSDTAKSGLIAHNREIAYGEKPAPPPSMVASGQVMTGPPTPQASLSAAIPPDNEATESPSQADEREYDPNVLHAAVMNRNEPADMAEQVGYMPPPISPDPNRFGPEMANQFNALPDIQGGMPMNNDMRNMAGLEPLAQPPPMSGQPPMGNQPYDAPPQDDGNGTLPEELARFGGELAALPGQIGRAVMPADQSQAPVTLRDALIGSGRPSYPAPNQPNILDALRQALAQDQQSKMAGY